MKQGWLLCMHAMHLASRFLAAGACRHRVCLKTGYRAWQAAFSLLTTP